MRFALVILAALAVIGCAQPNRGTSSDAAGTVPNLPPVVTPPLAVPVAPHH